jgi:hypothetical protein
VVDARVLELARQAAELLPEPPAPHDAFGMLAWEELVLSTARRLQAFLDDATLLAPPATTRLHCASASGRLDGASLITLAVLLIDADDHHCEALLHEALAAAGDQAVLAGRG